MTLEPGVEELLREQAALLIKDNDMVQVDLDVRPPNLAAQWMMGNLSTLLADLGDRWPSCARDLTDEVAIGLYLAQSLYNLNTAAVAERMRVEANVAMADAFERGRPDHRGHQPGPGLPRRVDHQQRRGRPHRLRQVEPGLPLPVPGRPVQHPRGRGRGPQGAVGAARLLQREVPRHGRDGRAHHHLEHLRQPGRVDPGRHRRRPAGRDAGARPPPPDAQLFDVALSVERERPWPMVAPAVADALPTPA